MSTAPVTLAITGMTCSHCVASVQKALGAVPGLSAARVALGFAELHIDSANPDQVVGDAVREIARAGYDAAVGQPSRSVPAPSSCCSAPTPQPLARD
jgi:copper chaperone CopZ